MTSGSVKMLRGTYVGVDESRLIGKTALIMVEADKVKIQADDVSTGYGYGWHIFPLQDWEINNERMYDECT